MDAVFDLNSGYGIRTMFLIFVFFYFNSPNMKKEKSVKGTLTH